ncbi:hypothetical protein ACLMJK_001326 [Lecanora helva]
MHISSLCLLPAAFLFGLNVSATCFWPNGSAAGNYQQPCNPSGHSMCCLLNPESGSANADVCTADGLCIPSYNGYLFRDTCTDSTWKDPACLNLCTTGQNEQGNRSDSNYGPLTTCADGSLCCGAPGGDQSTKCCTKRKGQWVENGKGLVSTKPASLTATAQTTLAAAATDSPSTANQTSSAARPSSTSKSSSNNTGAIVGGVVGGVAAVVILGLAFWYFMIRRSLAQKRNQPQMSSYEPYGQQGAAVNGDQKYWPQPASDMPVQQQQGHFRGELGTETAHHAPELDSAQVK